MTDTMREKYRQSLMNLAQRVRKDVVHLKDEAEHPLGELPGQFSEMHNEQAEQGLTLSLLGNEQELSAAIRSALQRLKDGTYAICVKCQKPISQERLHTIPYTNCCIHCA